MCKSKDQNKTKNNDLQSEYDPVHRKESNNTKKIPIETTILTAPILLQLNVLLGEREGVIGCLLNIT